tara:strand:- start:30 stop:455 length:426 start_codon:yes stop_codon:yes gene_type:complete
MRELMSWDICQKEHIKKVQIDQDKIDSIKKMCKIRHRVTKEITLDEETASIIASDYYEVIKELLTALLLKDGLKSKNHECLISFFKHKYKEYEYESNIIHKLKNIRNRVSYDGIFVKKDYILANKLEFEHIIELLTKLITE